MNKTGLSRRALARLWRWLRASPKPPLYERLAEIVGKEKGPDGRLKPRIKPNKRVIKKS